MTTAADAWAAPVSEDDALTAACPFCGSPRGTRCTYTSPYGKVAGEYAVGQPTQRAHWQRKRVVRDKRAVAARRDTRPVIPASRDVREASAAMRAWDLAEYEKLREWLADWAWLLTEAGRPKRPDGTLRGESYAFGQD